MKLGLILDKGCKRLFDLETGEIYASDRMGIQNFLKKHENQYTLQLV